MLRRTELFRKTLPLLALLCAAACSDYDEGLLTSQSAHPSGAKRDGGIDHASTAADAATDAAGDAASSICVPNPDTANELCTKVCPEICNGRDDDCDGEIDEDNTSPACNVAHTTATCVQGACLIVSCDDEYRDCDHQADNGCEARLTSDPDNCGACGHRCSGRHAEVGCSGGQCVALRCLDGFGDCDDDPFNCETPNGTDADRDGVYDCLDKCPKDPNKRDPGVCDCGTSDADTDGDGTLDCQEACPLDSNKTEPGICGCGAVDTATDLDGDGTPDCIDDCPFDPARSAGTCALPTNVDSANLSFANSPIWHCDAAGITMVDSATGAITSTSCELGTLDVSNDVPQLDSSGPNVMIVRLAGLQVTNKHVLKLQGDKPIVFLVAGDVLVDSGGKIDAGATAKTPGPGGSLASQCGGLTGGDGTVSGDGGGGGGGGFGSAGGSGGRGNDKSSTAGSAGGVSSNADLRPLRGGCSGGHGAGDRGAPGAGGGAFQISASGTIAIGTGNNTAYLTAAGGAGSGQPNNSNCTGDGGDGGGSGGGILLEAPEIPSIGSGGGLRAHGGGGGGGTECGSSEAGEDGHATDDTQASSGNGEQNQSDGAAGGLCRGVGCANANAAGATPSSSAFGAGGGGGGGGRIVVE